MIYVMLSLETDASIFCGAFFLVSDLLSIEYIMNK